MKGFQIPVDKFAIALSVTCVIHCTFLPFLLILLPSLTLLSMDNEKIHFWLIISIIPVSLFSLGLGVRKHHKYTVFTIALIGLLILLLTFLIGEERLGEFWERLLTATGGVILAVSHYYNFHFSQKADKS